MDPISTAIMAALASGAASRTTESEVGAIVEAYQKFKSVLRVKFGADSDLIDALEKLEQKPTSIGRREVLLEEVASAGADKDRELLGMVYALFDAITVKLDSEQKALDAPLHLQPSDTGARFIGRKAELAQLLAALQPGQVVALCGPAGIGKSTLAAEAVLTLTPNDAAPDIFPDGIIYHNFSNQPRVDIALERIARIFDEDLAPTPYDAAQRALIERQALLVLDGADQADDLSGILAIRGGCGILMTSRDAQEEVATEQNLVGLPHDDAIALLQAYGGSYAGPDSVVRRICDLVGGLPLAIRLVGHYLSTQRQPASNYLDWLEATPLIGMKIEHRQQQSILLLLEHTLAQVSQGARQTLAVVGLLALTPFNGEVIAEALTRESHHGVRAAIRRIFRQETTEKSPDIDLIVEELVDYGLLHRVKNGYEVSHPLIHTYAQQRLTAPATAIRRLATYYMGLTWVQSRGGLEGQAILDATRPHFMRVLAECLEWKDWEAAHSLAVAVDDYLDMHGYTTERIVANEIGLIAAWQLGRSNEAAWMGNLGDTYRTMGQAKWAIEHFEKALATARKLGDWHSEGNCLGNLGLAYRDLGRIGEARQYLRESQAIFEEISSPKAALVKDWLAELDEWEE